jgi:uncharacterized membrane protein
MEIQSNAVKPVGSIQAGWDIIKDDYWLFFGMTSVLILIALAASFAISLVNNAITLGVAAVLGGVSKDGGAASVSAAVIPQIVSLTISIFTGVLLSTLIGMLMCGLMNGLSRKVQTGSVEFGDLFSGFNKLQPCLIYSVIMSLINYAIAIGAVVVGVVFGVTMGAEMMLKDGKFDPQMFTKLFGLIFVVALIAIILTLIITVFTTFVYPLIAERNLSGMQALSASFRGGLSNILPLIGFIILQFLMVMAGALFCLVGILFVAPLLYASIFAAYRNVFGGPTRNVAYQQPPPPPIFNNQPNY